MTTPEAKLPEAPAPRPWLLLAAVVLSFFGLSAATLALPHDPLVRYQQLAPTLHFRSIWSYERVAMDKTPIDIAIIGNSRLQSAISAPVVQARLSERLGRPVHVVNLSLPQEGRNAHYAMATRRSATSPMRATCFPRRCLSTAPTSMISPSSPTARCRCSRRH